MSLRIAWRNIWRNPTRSFVVMGAIVVGVWSIIFLMGMVTGMMDNYVDKAIKNEISHIQINHPEFIKDYENQFYLEQPQEAMLAIKAMDGVQEVTVRSQTNAMLSTGRTVRGIRLMGVLPEQEQLVSSLSNKIIEGDYLTAKKRKPILISKRLADLTKAKIRTKLVLTFQDLNGEITSGAFRVAGIFDSGNNLFDEGIAYVRQSDLNGLLGKSDIGHQLAILVDNTEDIPAIKSQLESKYPDWVIRSYAEVSPELELFESQMSIASIFYMVIFMLALIFGIINTMLMAVLERTRELGMLMAIGMNRIKVFMMIVFETFLLGIIGAPIGILIGHLTIQYYAKNGLNLSFFSEEGMKQFGMSTFIYPSIDPALYGQLAFAVALTALLASIYPAIKAIRLEPMEAIRKI